MSYIINMSGIYSIFYILILFSFSHDNENTQIIPEDRRITWKPGIPGGIPIIHSPIEDILNYDADPNGIRDSHPAILSAVSKLPSSGGVVYIPEGTYLLKSPLVINKSNVVIRGAGMTATQLLSDNNGISVKIGSDTAGKWQKIINGYYKGSAAVTVENGSAFTAGSFMEIRQDNDSSLMYTQQRWKQSWAKHSVGQVLQVEEVKGNMLLLKNSLHHTFSKNLNPVVRPVDLVKNVGIEHLRIKKLKPNDHTFVFSQTAYCWMKKVESYMTRRSHVHMSASLGNEIRNCFFHQSYDHGGGGHGYGVECSDHTTGVLVEDNIFDSLRHAMMVQTGANGNVFAYNYSTNPVQGEPGKKLNQGWIPPDISIHGHYPFMNLFEGNDVVEIGIADYWGPAGPGNTYLRNNVRGEGIFCYDHSYEQNLIGNITTHLINEGNNCLRMLKYGNIITGEGLSESVSSLNIPLSCYLDEKPLFLKDHQWPPFGPGTKKDNILPAQERYEEYMKGR